MIQANGSEGDNSIYLEGEFLSSEAVAEAEATLLKSDCLELRLRLLYYYLCKDCCADWHRHAMWLIEHRPTDWLAGNMGLPRSLSSSQREELIKLWQIEVDRNSTNALIIGRAAEFVSGFDSQQALLWLSQAETLSPSDPRWYRRAFYVHLELARISSEITDSYEKACEKIELLLEFDENEAELCEVLKCVCNFAIAKEDYARAVYFARLGTHIAERSNRLPHELFRFRNLRGYSALRLGDKRLAAECLLAAGSMHCRYINDLPLADELLKIGESSIVLDFLLDCLDIANSEEQQQINCWIQEIDRGLAPKFLRSF